MDKRCLVVLATLAAPACAAAEGAPDAGGLPALRARLLETAPGTIDLAGFDIRHLQRPPAARAELADENDLGWAFWAARAEALRLDPIQDASFVAVAVSVGPCGITDDFVLAAPSRDPDELATHVDEAVRTWRREHPTPSEDEDTADSDGLADPALSGWVPLADGACTILQVGAYTQLGVTLRTDGSLLLRGTPFGDACRPQSERILLEDPSP